MSVLEAIKRSTSRDYPLVKTFLFWWVLTLFIKCILGLLVPLFSDEAYYWVWSHHLQLSYYDHPPFIAWLFWLGHVFEPLRHASRWPGILLGHMTLLLWYGLLKPYVSQEKLAIWFMVMLVMPLTGPGSLIMVPDLPLMFFWSLAIFAMTRALKTGKLQWYFCLGMAIGLGFCSKYHIVLFPFILVIWLTFGKHWQKINLSHFFITVSSALLFSLPVIIWNFNNDFVSFAFQLHNGLGASNWELPWTTSYVLGQMALSFPLIIWAAKRTQLPVGLEWLPWFYWGPLVFFLLTSFKGKVEANWPIMAYPCLIALAIINAENLAWIKRYVVVCLAGLMLILSHILHPWFPVNHQKLRTSQFTKYKPLLPYAQNFTPFFASEHKMAAQLMYYLKAPVYKLKGMSHKDFYDFLPESVPQTPTWFIAMRKPQHLPIWAKEEGFIESKRLQINGRYDLVEVTKASE